MDTKTMILGLVCAAMDGRSARVHVMQFDGDQCVVAHNLLKGIDDLLKAQWRLMGAPDDKDIL